MSQNVVRVLKEAAADWVTELGEKESREVCTRSQQASASGKQVSVSWARVWCVH